jgi:hypothetical protein
MTVARPERQLSVEAAKVARPGQQSPSEAIKSQDTFFLATDGLEQLTPATIDMSPDDQAQVARWREQASKGRIVPPGHESTVVQRFDALSRVLALDGLAENSDRQDVGTPTKQATAPVFHIVKAAMPALQNDSMMLCPQAVAPVLYESAKGQESTPLQPLGITKAKCREATHSFSHRSEVEVLTDTKMIEGLDDNVQGLEDLLSDDKPIAKAIPITSQGLGRDQRQLFF